MDNFRVVAHQLDLVSRRIYISRRMLLSGRDIGSSGILTSQSKSIIGENGPTGNQDIDREYAQVRLCDDMKLSEHRRSHN